MVLRGRRLKAKAENIKQKEQIIARTWLKQYQ
jgi:hypothetical protein